MLSSPLMFTCFGENTARSLRSFNEALLASPPSRLEADGGFAARASLRLTFTIWLFSILYVYYLLFYHLFYLLAVLIVNCDLGLLYFCYLPLKHFK